MTNVSTSAADGVGGNGDAPHEDGKTAVATGNGRAGKVHGDSNVTATETTTDDTDEDMNVEVELEEAGIIEAPDGGYGWLVVIASFFANMIVDGVGYTAGQGFQPEWERHYGSSSGATAWVVSLLTGFYMLSGPFVAVLVNKYGCRIVTMAGTVVAASGFVLSMFAPNVQVLYITFGVLGGVGFGMMYMPSIMIVSFYFSKRRALATGLAVCGSGIGMFVFAPLNTFMMEHLDWKNALLITAGITANGLVCGALFRELQPTEAQIERVVQIALEHQDEIDVAAAGAGAAPGEQQPRPPVPTINVKRASPTRDTEEQQSPLDKLLPSAKKISGVRAQQEGTKSPHVMSGVLIERFDDGDNVDEEEEATSAAGKSRGSIRPPSTDSQGRPTTSVSRPRLSTAAGAGRLDTPFKSAIEISVRGRTATMASGQSHQDIFKQATRDAVHTLNKPMSRADIFFAGSTADLAAATAAGARRGSLALRQLSHVDGGGRPPAPSMLLSHTSLVYADSEVGGGDTQGFVANARAVLATMMDMQLLKSPSFVILACSGFMTMAGFYVPFIYMCRQAVHVGVDNELAALLVSILGIVNIAARIMCGWLSDRPQLDALMIYNVAVTVGGLATMCVPFFSAYWHFVVYCCFFGTGTACFASLRSIICVELFGLEKLTNAFGITLMFMGVACLVGSPIAGTLADMTGSYDVSFYVMGACIAVSGVIGFPLRMISRWELRRAGELDDDEVGANEAQTNGDTVNRNAEAKGVQQANGTRAESHPLTAIQE